MGTTVLSTMAYEKKTSRETMMAPESWSVGMTKDQGRYIWNLLPVDVSQNRQAIEQNAQIITRNTTIC